MKYLLIIKNEVGINVEITTKTEAEERINEGYYGPLCAYSEIPFMDNINLWEDGVYIIKYTKVKNLKKDEMLRYVVEE
jgi:hypothetical protein